MSNLVKNLIIAVLGMTLILTMFEGCDTRTKYQNSLEQVLSLTQERQQFQKTIDEQDREITSTRNVVLEKTKEVEAQLKEIEQLKSLEQKVVFSTETKYETLTIPIHDTLIVTQKDTVAVKTFSYNDNWLAMTARIVNDKVTFDSLKVFNKYNLEFGVSKGGLFKKKEKMVYIRNENPHTTTKDVASFKLEQKPKWYERGVWKVVGGGAAVFMFMAF
jgi:hypothetical protein